MSMFNAGDASSNLAKGLAIQSILSATSRYVKNAPVPVGNYQPLNPSPKVQRYGSNRRLNQVKAPPSQSNQSQQQQITQSVSVGTRKQQDIQVKTFTGKNGSKPVQTTYVKTQIRQNYTPKPRRVLGGNNNDQKKDQGVDVSPKSSVGNKLGPQVSSKGSGLFDFLQTPQPAGRYGTNRRIQSKKTEQIISKYEPQSIKLTTQVQPPKNSSQIYNTPNPSQTNRRQKQSTNIQSPITSLSRMAENTQNSDKIETVSNITYQSRTSEPKKIARSQVRNLLKEKQQTVVTPSRQSNVQANVQVQTEKVKKNRSNIILFASARLYRLKLLESFSKLRQNLLSVRQKQNKLTKIFLQKLSRVQTNANLQLSNFVFKKITKYLPIQTPVHHNQESYKKLSDNCRKLLPNILHSLYISKVFTVFDKLKSIKNKKIGVTQYKLFNILQGLYNKKLSLTYSLLKSNDKNKLLSQTINFNSILAISKRLRARALQYGFRKLISQPRKLDENKQMLRQSPIHIFKIDQSSPESSPKRSEVDIKLLKLLEQKIDQNSKKLKQLKNENKKEEISLKNTIENLKNSCNDLNQANQQRAKIKEELKQRAQSLQILEQDYIQNSDLLTQSKFTFLYEIYIKLEKLGLEEVKVSDFYHVYPSLEQQIRSDTLINQWMTLQHNIWLKRQLGKYQGQSQSQRKAARLTNNQCSMLTDMIKGYIKQKYTWQWVKNAVTNMTLSSQANYK